MQLVIQKSKAVEFMQAMAELNVKFKGYITGELSDNVRLTATANGKPDLEFIQPVPEVVRIACYTALIENLL